MAREELISSAVSRVRIILSYDDYPPETNINSTVIVLQDPSVSSAPLEKKVAFLQSKNLTKEEIDLAFARAGEDKSAVPASNQVASYPQSSIRQQFPLTQGYGYGPGQWQAPPPELPKRDWRDWFIMATVAGGVSYGLYVVAKRYITPLIAPPTPPQLQQDKDSIDEQFSRAFELLDQLSSDTSALKATENARTERLDAALRDVEDVVAELKSSSRRRDDETRRMGEEIRSLKDGIPKAIEGSREGNEKRLRELSGELKSLKILLGSRLGSSATPGPSTASASSQVEAEKSPTLPQAPNTTSSTPEPPMSMASPTQREASSKSPFGALGKPASIPAWQMAAASKAKDTVGSSSTNNAESASPPS
ncbi:peroxisomal membrane protein pex14 [Ophidiomyces ophidiicola]|nr:peroxisomal membrane protein pex14 [Ophidiomyces ophidiicola]